MIRKRGTRFSEKIMRKQRAAGRDVSISTDRILGAAVARIVNTLFAAALLAATPAIALAQGAACTAEAERIRRAESELPKLEVAPPDRTIICITLETNMLFARRLSAHLEQCPRSPLARSGGAWSRLGRDYSARFSSAGCKPTIRPYRG
jgi:hypothetical protein